MGVVSAWLHPWANRILEIWRRVRHVLHISLLPTFSTFSAFSISVKWWVFSWFDYRLYPREFTLSAHSRIKTQSLPEEACPSDVVIAIRSCDPTSDPAVLPPLPSCPPPTPPLPPVGRIWSPAQLRCHGNSSLLQHLLSPTSFQPLCPSSSSSPTLCSCDGPLSAPVQQRGNPFIWR